MARNTLETVRGNKLPFCPRIMGNDLVVMQDAQGDSDRKKTDGRTAWTEGLFSNATTDELVVPIKHLQVSPRKKSLHGYVFKHVEQSLVCGTPTSTLL